MRRQMVASFQTIRKTCVPSLTFGSLSEDGAAKVSFDGVRWVNRVVLGAYPHVGSWDNMRHSLKLFRPGGGIGSIGGICRNAAIIVQRRHDGSSGKFAGMRR